MKIAIDIKGNIAVQKALLKLGKDAPRAMGSALYQEANDILRVSQTLVPVDTATLKGSGMVGMPAISRDVVTVQIGYGGAASAYAEVQHEELSYQHKPPTQAKYLEQPFLEATQNGMDVRIADKLEKELLH